MCGRFTLRTPIKAVAEAFDIDPTSPALVGRQLRFNIAPTEDVLAVRCDADTLRRQPVVLRWGLVPRWAEEPNAGPPLINARAESVAEKPAFRESLRLRRCLIPADGFYEWLKEGRQRLPHYVRRKDDRPFAFAGLWDRWRRGPQSIESCTIVTTDANEVLRPLHDRMPVILDPHDYERWLDPAIEEPQRVLDLLRPYDPQAIVAMRVGLAVNKVSNDGPECLEAPADERTQQSLF